MSGARIDFCHLLEPPPQGWDRLVVLGATPDVMAAVGAAGLARRVSDDPAELDQADAVILRDGHGLDPMAVGRRLRPGAVLSVEVRRRRPWSRSAGRIEARLRSAGTDPRARYWALPDLPRAHRFVPLDRPGPLRWYARHVLVTGSWPLRVLRRVLVVAGTRPVRRFAPDQVVVAVRPPGPGSERRPVRAGPDRFVLTSGNDALSRSVVCEFVPGSEHPDRVRKIATRPSGNDAVVAEQGSLEAVRSRLPAHLTDTVPTPLGVEHVGKLLAGIETGVSGVSLVASSGAGDAERAIADLELGAGWLRALAEATARHRHWDPDAVAAWLPAPAPGEDPAGAGRALAGRMAAVADSEPDLRLVTAWRHHDFGPWNLFRDGNRLQVVDWEWWPAPPDRSGPALADLVYLITYWFHVAGAHHSVEAQVVASRALWVDPEPTSPLVRAARAVIAREATALGVPAAALPLVVAHTWLDQSAHVAHRRRDLGDAAPDRPVLAALVVEQLASDVDRFVRTTTDLGLGAS